MSHIKNDRTLLFSVLGGVVVLLLVGISLWNQEMRKQELEETHASLISKLNATENEIRTRQVEIDQKKSVSVKGVTGFDPSLIGSDAETAKLYFTPAFSWKSGKDYDRARSQYIESLGENNAFTKTYLPPDTKIDTNDGPLSYIDFKRLKASIGNIHVVPMKAEGDRIRYVAFVQYFMHQSNEDLVNPAALEKSEAIIEFTAAGDRKNEKRFVTEVTARPGFHSTLNR